FPILQPDPDHIRLRLAREGLEAIQDITTPVAAVAVSLAFGLFYTSVIGPYRSGKSFLLNQLLSLPCNEGAILIDIYLLGVIYGICYLYRGKRLHLSLLSSCGLSNEIICVRDKNIDQVLPRFTVPVHTGVPSLSQYDGQFQLVYCCVLCSFAGHSTTRT
ncbi:hypothetical protein GW17_00029780, partial [Ensete ventricosum]